MKRQVVLGIAGALGLAWTAGAAYGPVPPPVPLYPDGVPQQLKQPAADDPDWGLHTPTLNWYPAPATNNTGAAVVVCPGGGYSKVCITYEGYEVAEWLNTLGVGAVVLNYRMSAGGYRHPVPMLDVQRAIRTVRATGARHGIRPDKIGVCGFSAGGHLAATAMTHYDAGQPDAADPVARVSCRPDFGILGYPVIQLTPPFTHGWSRRNLLGDDPPPELVDLMSADRQVTPDTPPVFIVQTDDDTVVPAENAVAFYLACRRHKVPAELHVFKPYPHGGGLCRGRRGEEEWPRLCALWLRNLEIVGR